MYGYGDKALKLGIHGTIEYKEKVSMNFKDEGFYKELEDSLNFVRRYGKFPKSIYLSSYSEEQNENGLNRKFGFNFRINDMVVFNNNFVNNEALTIEVINGQIVFFRKNIKKYAGSISVSDQFENPLGLDEVIENNYSLINSNSRDYNFSIYGKINASDYVFHILQEIKSFDLVLYNSNDFVGEENLIPAWSMKIGDMQYIFNAYTGEVLFYTRDNKGV
jgi:hypothetical protein